MTVVPTRQALADFFARPAADRYYTSLAGALGQLSRDHDFTIGLFDRLAEAGVIGFFLQSLSNAHSEYWLQACVSVPFCGSRYAVIFEPEVKTDYGSEDEFADEICRLQDKAAAVLALGGKETSEHELASLVPGNCPRCGAAGTTLLANTVFAGTRYAFHPGPGGPELHEETCGREPLVDAFFGWTCGACGEGSEFEHEYVLEY